MSPTRIARTLLLSGVAFAFAACGGDSAGPEQIDPNGSLSFSYSGAVTGSFSASGAIDPNSNVLPAGGSGATAFTENGATGVLAYRSVSATRADLFVLMLGQVTGTGTITLDPLSCSGETATNCRIGMFARELDPTQVSDPDLLPVTSQTWVLAIGSVNVTSRSNTRLRGTFSGTAVRAEDLLGGGLPTGFVSIANGSFDVPIQQQ